MSRATLLLDPNNEAVICHQAAHLISWKHAGVEQLFVSEQADFTAGKAIRGGVPLIFPQFGALGAGQKHGFTRNVLWQQIDNIQPNSLTYELEANEETLAIWPFQFKAVFTVSLEDKQLRMQFEIANTDTKTFDFTAALHTYFRVNDVRNIEILGVQDLNYWDNGTPFNERYRDENPSLHINGPLDRIYFDSADPILLKEGTLTRKIQQSGFSDTVIWNPWQEGAEGFSDMQDEEFLRMMCIEAAVANSPIALKAGEQWQGEQVITLG